ncbi:MAG: hypothetical protein ACJ780_16775 [Solirubrobacteraceae bacterium]
MGAITGIATTAPVHVVDVDAHKGPVYFADEDALYFSTLPALDRPVQIKRLQCASRDRIPRVRASAGSTAATGTGDRGRGVAAAAIQFSQRRRRRSERIALTLLAGFHLIGYSRLSSRARATASWRLLTRSFA